MMPMRRQSRLSVIEWVVIFVACLILCAILYPFVITERDCATGFRRCLLNQCYLALSICNYIEENDENLPIPSAYHSLIKRYTNATCTCPESKHHASTISPDYGMNAYLFDINVTTTPQTRIGLSFNKIADPTVVELTADITGMANDPTSPFPNTYTVTGLGETSNIAYRHKNAAIVTYVDGHARFVKSGQARPRPNQYCLPR